MTLFKQKIKELINSGEIEIDLTSLIFEYLTPSNPLYKLANLDKEMLLRLRYPHRTVSVRDYGTRYFTETKPVRELADFANSVYLK